MPRRGLGRGLDALIPTGTAPRRHAVVDVRVGEIAANPYQPRAQTPEEDLEELSQSIRRHGVIQPLVVRQVGDVYQLVAGERRWRAAQRAGLTTVPCLVRDVSDEDTLQMALVENLQRSDLTAIEAARGYEQLMRDFGATQAEVAEQVGKSRTAVTNTLRLLRLPQEIQDSLQAGGITEGHARALLGISDERALFSVWRRVQSEGLSVRATERLVKAVERPSTEKKAAPAAPLMSADDPHIVEAAERIQAALGTRVTIKPKASGGGHILIEFFNDSDLTAIVETIEGSEWAAA
ncbi:MAG: ParB/RepB/Spo0J family partition protein [Armatimonadota bacterium]